MDLNLRHLQVLCTIEEEGSLGKAAARLGISQPALTGQLHRIERELNQTVFLRGQSGAVPTAAGRGILIDAHAALAALERLREGARSLHTCDQTVRVGGHGPLLVALVEGLHDKLGRGVRIAIRSERSSRLLETELEQGKIDYAIVSDIVGYEASPPRGIAEWVLIEREPIFVGMSRQHHLADQDEIDLVQLRDESWTVSPHDDTGEDELLDKVCRQAGFQPKIGLITDDNGVARSFIGRGYAVALFESRAAEDHELVVRPLRDNPMSSRIVLRWRTHDEPRINSSVMREALQSAYDKVSDEHSVYSAWRAKHTQSGEFHAS